MVRRRGLVVVTLRESLTEKVMSWAKGAVGVPVMMPVAESRERPAGRVTWDHV